MLVILSRDEDGDEQHPDARPHKLIGHERGKGRRRGEEEAGGKEENGGLEGVSGEEEER